MNYSTFHILHNLLCCDTHCVNCQYDEHEQSKTESQIKIDVLSYEEKGMVRCIKMHTGIRVDGVG